MIPYGSQDIVKVEIDTVVGVLKSDFLTQHLQVPLLVQPVANQVGAKYAVVFTQRYLRTAHPVFGAWPLAPVIGDGPPW
jgi:hypothetical protein